MMCLPKEDPSRKRVRTRAMNNKLKQPSPLDLQVHPLLIPDVIADILARLSFFDIKNARRVCVGWNEEASKLLPSKGKISLNTFEDVDLFVTSFEGSRNVYTRFKFGQGLNLQDQRLQRFVKKFGSKITYLHLDWTHWIPASLRKLLYEKLPVLEELIICSSRVFENIRFSPAKEPSGDKKLLPNIKVLKVDGDSEGSVYQFVCDLIRAMPNLQIFRRLEGPKRVAKASDMVKKLKFAHLDNCTNLALGDSRQLDLLFSKCLIRGIFRLPDVVHLKVTFSNEKFALLRQLNYALKSLEVVIPSEAFMPPHMHYQLITLHNYISSLNKTLASLKLSYCPGPPKLLTSFDTIGRLRNLRHLSLNRVSGPLDFLYSLPQLKSLHMTQEEFIQHYDEFHIDEGRVHKLQSLKLFYTNWSASSIYSEVPRPGKVLNVVENIVRRFPHLRSFRMETLTDKALNVIYNNLPQLEELEATNGVFTSVGVSGISVVHQGQVNLSSRKNSYIGCLENLKRLKLESNKMTDFGIVSSVVFLKTLQELSLLCYKITDESLSALVTKMNLKQLKTEFCYELSSEAIQSAKCTLQARGAIADLNPLCQHMDIEAIHAFLNENGPIHVSIPAFPPVEND